MTFQEPDTKEKRRAGMAAFRARMLATHERLATDQRLGNRDRAYQRELVRTIKTAQRKLDPATNWPMR